MRHPAASSRYISFRWSLNLPLEPGPSRSPIERRSSCASIFALRFPCRRYWISLSPLLSLLLLDFSFQDRYHQHCRLPSLRTVTKLQVQAPRKRHGRAAVEIPVGSCPPLTNPERSRYHSSLSSSLHNHAFCEFGVSDFEARVACKRPEGG